jgi:hypothetical protein
MGGWGSGRHRKPGYRLVESCWVLDVNDLSARGCLQPGLFSTCRWLDGNGGIFSIGMRYEAESGVGMLCLSWRSRHIPGERGAGESGAGKGGAGDGGASGNGGQGGEQGEVTEIVPIVRSPCRFGGSQPFFLCPGVSGSVSGGVGCGRRVGKLYLAHRYFLCRHCSKLVHASPYGRQPWRLAARRANKLRQRLGITGLVVPNKPSGMLAADYERLLEETLQAEIQATEASTERILQLVAWIDRRRLIRRHRRTRSSAPLFTL